MAEGKRDETVGQTIVKAIGQGSGNPSKPCERNPIEGKFGQAKNGYGMNWIRARFKDTGQSWIASVILVLNLVNLSGVALLWLGFSALGAQNCNIA